MPRIDLTDDEVAMLNWFHEFPHAAAVLDETTTALLAKGLLEFGEGKARVTEAGRDWLDYERPFF